MTDKPEFKRENRYIVVKRSHLERGQETRLMAFLDGVLRVEPVECVVVEHDWPEYEPVWQMLEARVTGAGADPVPPVGGAAQVLNEAEAAIRTIIGFEFQDGELQTVNADDLLAVYLAGRTHVTRLQAEVERLGKRVEEEVATAISNELKSERDVLTLQAELTKARDRVYDLEHAIFHALDDSGEDATTGEITIYKLDFEKLSALVPEDWEHRSEADKPTRAERVEQLNQEIATLLAQDDHE